MVRRTSGKGYAKIYRQIQDCWVWQDKPFSFGNAWIDIILSCNHSEKKICFDKKPMTISRGEWVTSILSLAERWGWGRKQVSSFLDSLEADGMISQDRNNRRTLIKVLNYDIYQGVDDEEVTTHEQQTNNLGTTHEQLRNTNNNDKNDKKDNKDIYINNIKNIVEFLNLVCGTHYKASTDNTKKHIRARLCEGYTVEDFKTVITKKHNEWKDNPKMVKYLRPDTLFGSKFESYLNQIDKGVKQSDRRMADTITGDAERDREIEEYLKSDEFLNGDDESLF